MVLTLLPGMAFAIPGVDEYFIPSEAPSAFAVYELEEASAYTGSISPESEQFFDEAAQLIADTWCDGFFGEIVFVIGEPYMWVDGVQYEIDPMGQVSPFVVDSEVLIPLCVLVEETGGTISFDMFQESIMIEDDYIIEIELQNNVTYFDREAQYWEATPMIENDIVMLSANDAIFEELGFEVNWEPSTEQVILTRDFQTRRLIVRTVTEKDFTNLGATAILNGRNNVTFLQFETRQEAQKVHDWLSEHENVVWVEPDIFIPFVLPIDYSLEFAEPSILSSPPTSWGAERVGAHRYAEFLHSRETDHSVIVAVIDSGVDAEHPFLQGRVLDGRCLISTSNRPYDADGHGTHVAGIVVDSTPDLDIQILPIRVGRYGVVIGTLANSILWATDAGADVINMSISIRGFVSSVYDAIQYAIDNNTTVVLAAGNNAGVFFPSRIINGMIGVAATNPGDAPAWFTNGGSAVDLAAPGENILSSVPIGSRMDLRAPLQYRGTGFVPADGTSMAAPHVAAAVAMYVLENPGISPTDIQVALRQYVDVPPGWNSTRYGTGILNMQRAIPIVRQPVNTWDELRDTVNAAPANVRTIIPIAGNLTTIGASNSSAIHIPADRNIVLENTVANINRYVDMQSFSQRHFTVNGQLTLRDGITLRGSSNAGGVQILAGGTFTMWEGSVIENCRWTTTSGGGVNLTGINARFYLLGGVIRNNSALGGGGIAISPNATVTMRNGSIEGNSVVHTGGGVAVAGGSSSTFTMTGGTIRNNMADRGGGVFVNATAVGAFTMTGGSITDNRAVGNGGGIYTIQADHSELVSETSFRNLRIGERAVFAGNRATFTSAPPDNANALSHLRFAQASSQGHILNNRDINYTASEVPDYQITFHFDADSRGHAGTPISVDITPGQALTIAHLAGRRVPVDHILSTADIPGWALWGWFREAELTEVRQGQNRPTVGAEGFDLTSVITQDMIDTYFDNGNLDLFVIWSLWGDADDDGEVTSTDVTLMNQRLHDELLMNLGAPPHFNNPINLRAANVTVSGTMTSADVTLMNQYLFDQLLIDLGAPAYFGVVLGMPIPIMASAFSNINSHRGENEYSSWFVDAIQLLSESEPSLCPDEKINRAMAVSMLHHLVGSPNVEFHSIFGSVPSDQWFSLAVTWVHENGLAQWAGGSSLLYHFAESMGLT